MLGRPFTAQTDNTALTALRATKEPRGRDARWIEALAEFDFSVVHRPGSRHRNADAMSRIVDILGALSADPDPAALFSGYDVGYLSVHPKRISVTSAVSRSSYGPLLLRYALSIRCCTLIHRLLMMLSGFDSPAHGC